MRVVCLGPFVPRQLLGRAWLQPHAQYFWCTCRKSHISPFASGLPTAQPCSSAVRAARGASWPRVDLLKPCCHRCLYPGAPGSWAVSQRARHGEGSVYKEELNRFSGVPSHLYACGQASKKKKREKRAVQTRSISPVHLEMFLSGLTLSGFSPCLVLSLSSPCSCYSSTRHAAWKERAGLCCFAAERD